MINKSRVLYYLWLVLVLLIPLSLFGQLSNVKFDHISTKNGLNQNSILALYQDNDGFLWIGTYAGLNRYDGTNIIGYQHNYINTNTISGMHIRSICEDTSGVLLVATTTGINRFFTHTREFVNFSNDTTNPESLANNTVYNVIKDPDGNIWLGTWGGLDKMERIPGNYADERNAEYRFIHFTPDPNKNSISSSVIADMDLSPDGILWLATNNGLNAYYKKNNTFKSYLNNPADLSSISVNDVSSVCSDKKGNIWAGTWEGGLNFLDRKTDKFIRFKSNQNDKSSLSHNIIMSLYCDKNGDIWVGTWGGGLGFIDLPEKYYSDSAFSLKYEDIQFINYQHQVTDLYSLSGNSIYCIYEDKFNNIWIGTDWNGLNKLELNKDRFTHFYAEKQSENNLVNNVIYSLLLDENDLWIGTEEGVNIYNRETSDFKLFQSSPSNPESISHNHVRSLLKDNNGDIWIGTENGLNKYNRETNSFQRFNNIFDENAKQIIISLSQSKDGKIWIGTYAEGLICFNPLTKTSEKFKNIPGDPNSLSDNIIWKTLEDSDGNIWIATEQGGLCKLNRSTGVFSRYTHNPNDSKSLANNFVVTLFIDSENNFWVGTRDGLCKMTFNNDGKPYFTVFHQNDGLSSPTINGITEDEMNNLWLTTTKGLTRFNKKYLIATAFYESDGLQDNEFSINALLRDKKTNEIFAGGINGFNIFKPNEIISSNLPPATKIIDFKILHKSVEINEEFNKKVYLYEDIVYQDCIEPSYKEDIISFEYSAIHFSAQSDNEFAYMLKGYDSDWNYVGNERVATYRQLPPGKYTFMVKAANGDGIWQEQAESKNIIIKPPWWKTIVFRIFVFILLVTTVFCIYFARISFLKKRQIELENMVMKRTEELSEINVLLEEKQEEIVLQNDELLMHRNALEELVKERTAELLKAKSKAEESDKLKSAFLANMSHEIRTPMNAIVGFSSLLITENSNAEEREYLAQMIQNNSDTLLTLINDILDISSIEANQIIIYKENFCVDDILKEIHSYFSIKNQKNIEIELVCEAADNNTHINSDPVRFRQVITNLVGNALKFTDKGYIRFGYYIEAKDVVFFVEDTGIGISKEDQKNIFNHFYKLERDSNKFYEGTGIGLSISKRLVELMGGTLSIESEMGIGSTFKFSLPISDIKEAKTKRSDKAITNYKFKDLLIVVAEDESNNYNLIYRVLKRTNAQIFWAKNGKEALDYVTNVKNNKKVLILMDIKMPVMDGIEATKKIKKLNKDIHVFAVTAYAQAGDKTRIMKNGFDDFITKPIDPDSVIEKIADFYAQ
ncbi:MAG: response regulator [Bacteroidales bacterium]|nr:response regulator [Bacteroidales bacterium]MBN2819061.1 response regulator [Bacteroidales bacterium]